MKNQWKIFDEFACGSAFAAGIGLGIVLFLMTDGRDAFLPFLYAFIAGLVVYWAMGVAFHICFSCGAIRRGLRRKWQAGADASGLLLALGLMSIMALVTALGGPLAVYLTSEEHELRYARKRRARQLAAQEGK